MQNLSDYRNVAVFTNELACPINGDPLCQISDIISMDGLVSGDTYRVATYKVKNGSVIEDKLLLLVTIL